MIPEKMDIKVENSAELSSKTWEIDFDRKRLSAFIDDAHALRQSILLRITTEHNFSDIYAGYGLQTVDLIGHEFELVAAELKRRIRYELMQDARITAVDDFEIKETNNGVAVAFTVATYVGNIGIEEVINL